MASALRQPVAKVLQQALPPARRRPYAASWATIASRSWDRAKGGFLWPEPSASQRNLAEMRSKSRASGTAKTLQHAKLRASGRLDRTQEVAGSSPASSTRRTPAVEIAASESPAR